MKHLSITKYILIGVLTLSINAFAGTDSKSFKSVAYPEDCRFNAQEVQVDLFGAGSFYKQGRPLWGGGLGVNYFPSKFWGLGVEQTIGGRKNVDEWGTFGNVFARYPICSLNVAPYAVAGIGALYGKNNAVMAGTIGGGLEYRITDHVGLFGDARWLYNATDLKDGGAVVARTGLRLTF